jgi:hypothetical protein
MARQIARIPESHYTVLHGVEYLEPLTLGPTSKAERKHYSFPFLLFL